MIIKIIIIIMIMIIIMIIIRARHTLHLANSLEIPLDDFTLTSNFQTMPPSLSRK